MSHTKLGSKWSKENQDQDLGSIHRYMKRKEGEIHMSKLNKTAQTDEDQNQSQETEDSDLEEVMSEQHAEKQPEPSMDINSAVISIMSLLEYSSSAKIDQAFNFTADLLKLNLDARKIDQDSKVAWMTDNVDKLQLKDAMSVYKILSV